MKAHVEIHIRLDLAGGKTLHDVLREFAGQTKGWSFPLENSLDYQKGHGAPAGFVVSDKVKGLERGAVAVANLDEKLPNHFRVPNIVPRDCGYLPMDKYNAIGLAFAKAFRQFLKISNIGGTVKVTNPNKELADIIKGEKCRKLFEAWLRSPAPISHPADVERLYVFICALFRYHSDARSYIPKANGKQRPLGIPTMKDRAMQALHLLALEPVAETTADPNSYGFRPERSTADALQQCFNALCRGCSPQWVLEGDIKGCFDHISHEWMLQHVLMDKAVLQKWLKAGYIENRTLFPTEAGTPQGGIISPTLANMTLDGLEKLLAKHFPRQKHTDGKRWCPKVNLVRYADDFIITGGSQELLEKEVRPLVEQFLKERGLALSTDKTRITHIDEGFDFLGQNLRKYDGKPLVKPSKKNTQVFLEKVRGLIEANQSVSQTLLMAVLNPVIRGWANYHRHCAASDTFDRVDHEIWRALWQWAKRRHPKKSRDWVKKHCFPAWRNRAWTFAAKTGKHKPDGTPIWTRLTYAGDTQIRRHVKIRRNANPFGPQWRTYFNERKFQKKFGITRQQAGINTS